MNLKININRLKILVYIITPKFTKKYSGNPLSGIFAELTRQNNGNICEKGIINITGNRCVGSPPVSSIVNFNHTSRCYNSSNEPNSYLCFDFKKNSISISSYSIKSSNHTSPDFLQTWVLEGSNDSKHWTVIDSHINDKSLGSKSKICVFAIKDQNINLSSLE